MAAHNELGQWGEERAARYLTERGYTIVARDWKAGHRDLDIVATDGEELVIVEVKTRSNRALMEPEQAVTPAKARSLAIAANAFIKYTRATQPVRFDIISVTGTSDDDCDIRHITNAFIPRLV